jgi:osmotically-inducible protein OsmY
MNERNRGRENWRDERRGRHGGHSRDVADDRGRGSEGSQQGRGDRYSADRYSGDRDWSAEGGYEGDRGEYRGDFGGGSDAGDDRQWRRNYGGDRGGMRSYANAGGSGFTSGGSSGYEGSRSLYGSDPYGRAQPSGGEWQRRSSDRGQSYDRSGSDQYRQGDRGQQWGQFGQNTGQHFGESQGQYGPSSQYGRGQYDSRRGGHEWSGNQNAWGRDQSQSWGSQQNHAGRGPKGYHRSDERLKEQASDRLMDDPQVDASEITIDVQNGEATLTGTVNSREEKRAAEACVEAVSGIVEVINQLRVNRGDSQSASAQNTSSAKTPGAGSSSRTSRSSERVEA